MSYTLMTALSARSATASSFLLGDSASAVMPSHSTLPGTKRCVRPSAAAMTTLAPTG
jgi:hypothetical protein